MALSMTVNCVAKKTNEFLLCGKLCRVIHNFKCFLGVLNGVQIGTLVY